MSCLSIEEGLLSWLLLCASTISSPRRKDFGLPMLCCPLGHFLFLQALNRFMYSLTSFGCCLKNWTCHFEALQENLLRLLININDQKSLLFIYLCLWSSVLFSKNLCSSSGFSQYGLGNRSTSISLWNLNWREYCDFLVNSYLTPKCWERNAWSLSRILFTPSVSTTMSASISVLNFYYIHLPLNKFGTVCTSWIQDKVQIKISWYCSPMAHRATFYNLINTDSVLIFERSLKFKKNLLIIFQLTVFWKPTCSSLTNSSMCLFASDTVRVLGPVLCLVENIFFCLTQCNVLQRSFFK